MTPPEPRRRITTDTGPCAIVPLWLIENGDVSDRALRVFALLAARWADREDRAYPSRQTIGATLPMSRGARARARRPQRPNLRGSVDRAIRELEKAGAITVERRPKQPGQPFGVNVYTLHRVRPDSRTHATTPSLTDAPTGGRADAPTDGRMAEAGIAASTRPEPEARNQSEVEREKLVSRWVELRRGLERYRFVDAKALRTLRGGIERALANGARGEDVEAAIEEAGRREFANPDALDAWITSHAAQREDRERERQKAQDREAAEREHATRVEAERAELRREYPGRTMREILELVDRPAPAPVADALARASWSTDRRMGDALSAGNPRPAKGS